MNAKQMQWQLYYLGYYKIAIDGIWGPVSIEAMKKFQKDYSLSQTGNIGSEATNKSKEIIKNIQKFLNANSGYTLVVDGLAGNMTKTATAAWQRKNGMTATGLATTDVLERMLGIQVGGQTGESQPSTPSTPSTGDWWDDIKYFKKEEFKCKCGGRYCNGYPAEIREDLVRIADGAREHFGRAAIVSSGLRCKQHNANVGGVYNSQHMYGEAVDIAIPGVTASQLVAYFKSQPGVRYTYAINNSYVHFDVPKGDR